MARPSKPISAWPLHEVTFVVEATGMGATGVYLFTELVTLETQVCGECGVAFAMPAKLRDDRLLDGKTFYCPNGHGRVFKRSEVDRLRAQLADAQRATARAEELRSAAQKEAERNSIALRNLRARTKNGACPCCKRSFAQLARHIATKHPAYRAEQDAR